jgi:CRP/FNR family transcriptional regulator
LADRLSALYPAVAALPAALRDSVLAEDAAVMTVPAQAPLFQEGAPCQGFPLLLSGEVRVARGAQNGRSLELYRVGPGELCVASTSCLFGHSLMVAHGATTEPTELVVLSPRGFDRWVIDAGFRQFVFGIFADRLADLMALADELGTVREIVTRLLKRFERAGWLRLGRERIELLDAAALRQLASGG